MTYYIHIMLSGFLESLETMRRVYNARSPRPLRTTETVYADFHGRIKRILISFGNIVACADRAQYIFSGSTSHYSQPDAIDAAKKFVDYTCRDCILRKAGACFPMVDARVNGNALQRFKLNFALLAAIFNNNSYLLNCKPLWQAIVRTGNLHNNELDQGSNCVAKQRGENNLYLLN